MLRALGNIDFLCSLFSWFVLEDAKRQPVPVFEKEISHRQESSRSGLSLVNDLQTKQRDDGHEKTPSNLLDEEKQSNARGSQEVFLQLLPDLYALSYLL
jgi:hypothetical protein